MMENSESLRLTFEHRQNSMNRNHSNVMPVRTLHYLVDRVTGKSRDSLILYRRVYIKRTNTEVKQASKQPEYLNCQTTQARRKTKIDQAGKESFRRSSGRYVWNGYSTMAWTPCFLNTTIRSTCPCVEQMVWRTSCKNNTTSLPPLLLSSSSSASPNHSFPITTIIITIVVINLLQSYH